MRRIEGVVLGLRPFEQTELHKARHLLQVRVAVEPDRFERILGALADAKPVHRNEHLMVSCSRRPSGDLKSVAQLPQARISHSRQAGATAARCTESAVDQAVRSISSV